MTYDEFIKEFNNQQNFIIAKTSGSTGTPKLIKLNKDFICKSAERTINFFKLNRNSRLHSCISPDYIGGKMMAVRAILAKAALTWEVPSNKPLKNIDKNEVLDLVAVVPSQMIFLIENKNKIPDVRNIIIGGSSIHSELRKKIIHSRFNAYETYGMTETASHIALRKINKENIPFVTLPGIRVDKDDDNCLKILFDSGEEIQTNDIAEIVSDHEFFIKGRRDHIIISGGKKINPFEIEEKISPLIPSDFCITGFSDEKWGQKVVLIIRGKEKDFKNLRNRLREIIKPWELPKDILYVKFLQHSENGKIIRPKDTSNLVFSDPDTCPSFEEQKKPGRSQ